MDLALTILAIDRATGDNTDAMLRLFAQRRTRDRHAVLLQWLVLRRLLKSGHLNLSLKLGDLLVQL